MPITSSAIKALRQSEKNHGRNTYFKKKVVEAFKSLTKLVTLGKKDEAKKELPKVYSLLDRAAKKNVFHANKSARKKSQAAAMVG